MRPSHLIFIGLTYVFQCILNSLFMSALIYRYAELRWKWNIFTSPHHAYLIEYVSKIRNATICNVLVTEAWPVYNRNVVIYIYRAWRIALITVISNQNGNYKIRYGDVILPASVCQRDVISEVADLPSSSLSIV